MKLIQIIASLIFAVLLASYCAQRRGQSLEQSIEASARAEILARNLDVETATVVEGVREQAVCGKASGQRFVYRDKAKHGGRMGGLVLERDFAADEFEPFALAWCGN